jgi:hypothetical protein
MNEGPKKWKNQRAPIAADSIHIQTQCYSQKGNLINGVDWPGRDLFIIMGLIAIWIAFMGSEPWQPHYRNQMAALSKTSGCESEV